VGYRRQPYLDALSGIAVCGLGHAHPKVTEALCTQAAELVHTSNLYGIAAQEKLGERLTALAGMDRVFFGNSGAEANEAAIKLARLWGRRSVRHQDTGHRRDGEQLPWPHARHADATGSRKVQAGFEPLVQGFVRVPFGDLDALRRSPTTRAEVVAVMVEPVQGEGGINTRPPIICRRARNSATNTAG
jgi:acetylornithine/N-succinyldiaminopimelate aminotransferase